MAALSAALALGASGLVLLVSGCAAPTMVPPGATDDEAGQVAVEQLEDYWSDLAPGQRRDVPAIERVAFTTMEDWSAVQVSCLREAGLPAREVNGGFAVDGYGDLTPAEAADARIVCMGQYPVDPRTWGYLSDEQVLYMYDFFVGRVAPCLATLGYAVTGPPDRYAYVGSVRTGFSWTPYGGTREARDWPWPVINARCPRLPEDPYKDFQPPAG